MADRHDPKTCRICAPTLTEAWRRGVARAEALNVPKATR